MAPETRSRGVPPPSRVYHASPTLQQVQFPSRKKKIRRHTDSERKGKSLKQQTLTQIDFVSSYDGDDDNVVASSEDDNDAGQNGHSSSEEEDDEVPIPRRRVRVGELAQAASKRRRRTMGDEDAGKEKNRRIDGGSRRRKTLGDHRPSANYHTQTLTQFLGHQTSFVADSEEEELCGLGAGDEEQDDGFLSWLEGAGPGSPSAGRGRRGLSSPRVGTSTRSAAVGENMSRETSVIPQTPLKKQISAVRFDIGSGGLPSPSERMMGRYGAPDVQDSPLKNRSSPTSPPRRRETNAGGVATPAGGKRRPSLVIRDSYTTEEEWCNTPSKSQSRHVRSTPKGKGTCRPTHILCTPSKVRTSQKDSPLARARRPKQSKTRSPQKMTRAGLYEIPDSDEDEDAHGMGDAEDEEEHVGTFDAKYAAGVETQAVMSEIASSHEQREAAQEREPCSPLPLPLPLPLPRSQSAKQHHQQVLPRTQTQATSQSTTTRDGGDDRPTSPAMAPVPVPVPVPMPTPTPVASKPIRRPLHHPFHCAQPSQPWESQRVPVSELQSLPAPSARSDILLPISSGSLHSLITGHTLAVTTLFRIPPQVVRFWLLEKHLLRYMATVGPGEEQQRREASPQACPSQPAWQFHATQVYELNNPVQEQDMLEEGWVEASARRYSYLPPAVVGQLLWNLRHALFGAASEDAVSAPSSHVQQVTPTHDGEHKSGSPGTERTRRRAASPPPSSMTVSQEVTAQIHSDMACSASTPPPAPDDPIPSTPGRGQTRRPGGRPKQQQQQQQQQQPEEDDQAPEPEPPPPRLAHHVHPSQATTLSQASTPDKPPPQHHMSKTPPPPPPLPASDPSIHFLDHSNPLSSLPIPSSQSSTSQLLTKSQLLPDSLLRDHPPPQPEIWDSDDDLSP
ncbi:hypothetical protein E4U53_006484 [Claviceps sorghi]|nr:hypothetical protein E4U53_006484 [Claviceps sorghi]